MISLACDIPLNKEDATKGDRGIIFGYFSACWEELHFRSLLYSS